MDIHCNYFFLFVDFLCAGNFFFYCMSTSFMELNCSNISYLEHLKKTLPLRLLFFTTTMLFSACLWLISFTFKFLIHLKCILI